MERRPLGATGLDVSSIGMGCVTFGREIDKETSFAVLDRARERGINLLDTAAVYAGGSSEAVLGEWLTARHARDDTVLATKVSGTLDREHVLSSVDASLARLKTDHIDLLQLHTWDHATPLEETLAALDVLVAAGKVRFLGCSNWQAPQLSESLALSAERGWPRMQSVQPPYNLVQREIEADLLPLCGDQRIGVLSYSPLAAGFLTGKYRRGEEVPAGTRFDVIPGHQPIYFTDHGYDTLDRLERTAGQTGRSSVQLALAWALTRPLVTSVLIGARSPGHVDQAFEAEALGLDEDLARELAP